MRIGLLGYGKMGHAIETIALERGHEIAWRINIENRQTLSPEAAYDNVMTCLRAGVPVVSGTTGWLDELNLAKKWCAEHQGAMLWASNFSIGVNLLFALNRHLAGLMNARPEYEPSVAETHHIHKIDAPSGTALTLTHEILNLLDRKNGWVLQPAPASVTDISVSAVRENEVPGIHTVRWQSAVDEITISHNAHSRAGFAAGALTGAEWLLGKTGVFSMEDVLNIGC